MQVAISVNYKLLNNSVQTTYRVSHNIGSTLFFCYFVGFYSTKIQKLGEYKKIQEICYKIGTKNFKIDLELAEIIDVKVATYNTKIIFLRLSNSKMSISK